MLDIPFPSFSADAEIVGATDEGQSTNSKVK